MNRVLRIFFLFPILLLASCSIYDPNYLELEAKVNTNPQPEDITGMWHRKSDEVVGVRQTYSLLFRSDQTGHYDSLMTSLLMRDDTRGTFRWKYEGGGQWSTTLDSGFSRQGFGVWLIKPTRWGISGNRLLQHTDHEPGHFYYVWERVTE